MDEITSRPILGLREFSQSAQKLRADPHDKLFGALVCHGLELDSEVLSKARDVAPSRVMRSALVMRESIEPNVSKAGLPGDASYLPSIPRDRCAQPVKEIVHRNYRDTCGQETQHTYGQAAPVGCPSMEYDDLLLALSARLKDLSRERGLNREKVLAGIRARDGGSGSGTLGRMFAGTGNPTLKNICAVAQFFGLQAWELLATEEEVQKTILWRIAGKNPPLESPPKEVQVLRGRPARRKRTPRRAA